MQDQQIDQAANHGGVLFLLLIILGYIAILAIVILWCVSVWKVFKKAGKPGWASLIPCHNTVVFLEIAGKPGWWFFLIIIPFVGIIFAILALVDFVERFGKGGGYIIGMIFLPFIFMPMLALGDAQYLGPKTDGPPGQPTLP